MPNLSDRPYVGTWKLDSRQVIQYTPDALVYINGQMTLPGCSSCNGQINFQKFITEVSVEAGIDPTGASASFTLSIPLHHSDSFARDGKFLLHPGLEVHVYERGYFPVKGLYTNLGEAPEDMDERQSQRAGLEAEVSQLEEEYQFLVQQAGQESIPENAQAFQNEADNLLNEKWEKTRILSGLVDPSVTGRLGLRGVGIEDILAYPYYHTFHGVVTQVSHSLAGGIQTVTVQCASMLHFWQYHKIAINAQVRGARAAESGLRFSLQGNIFAEKKSHPYQIMWWLYNVTMGHQADIGDALSKAENFTAFSEATGEQIWSQTLRYWERRFNQKQNRLRMHGINGMLFSAAQAAELGTTSRKKLMENVEEAFSRKRVTSAEVSKYNNIETTTLGDDRQLRGLIALEESGESANLNMAEMMAFVPTASEFGQVNLFETSYMSKLDVAQRVTEVTQFEFYQDVDGDFVFKPPMYNLDTSSSRVYVLEDIDLINISFEEKEPEATYAVVTQSRVMDDLDTSLGGWQGHRATYIDHKLVAQYGFRPLSFETTYFHDPRSMFFMGMSRLDVLNAPSKSASATIPLRPEMRQGYPVYIPYLDCYYYVINISHSFSVGGSCTTSLTLTAKRSKFYAPGRRNTRGIDSIDLADGTLPQRPLQVAALDGQPKLSGFPNVVMALDPEQINPLYLVSGANLARIKKPDDLRRLLRMASHEGIGVIQKQANGTYTFEAAVGVREDGSFERQTVTFYFQSDVETNEQGQSSGDAVDVPDGSIELKQALEEYGNHQTAITEKRFQENAAKRKIAEIDKEIQSLLALVGQPLEEGGVLSGEDIASVLASLRQEKKTWEAALAEEDNNVVATLADDVTDGVRYIMQLFDQIGKQYWIGRGGKSSEDMETAAMLNILSDKKVHVSGDSQPGSYRYYSASHPDPKHQGQKKITYVAGEGVEIQFEDTSLSERFAYNTIQGYVRNPVLEFDRQHGPEAEIREMLPTRGIRVLTTKDRSGEVLPTSEIYNLMFAVQDVEMPQKATDTKKVSTPPGISKTGINKKLMEMFSVAGAGMTGTITEEKTAKELFEDEWILQWRQVVDAEDDASFYTQSLYSGTSLSGLYGKMDVDFPTALVLGKSRLSTTVPLSTWASSNVPGGYVLPRFSSRVLSLEDLVNAIGRAIAWEMAGRVAGWASFWIRGLQSKEALSIEDQDNILNELFSSLYSEWRVPRNAKSRSQQTSKKRKRLSVNSPVFPVSDARGYEVVGSFQYGRGLDIEPGGVWDALRSQDPLSILGTDLIDELIRVLVRGGNTYVNETRVLPGGREVTVAVKVEEGRAKSATEQRVLEGLRKNYTEKQLIDMELLVPDDDNPGGLKLNLMNRFATAREGVHKLPLVNAARSLADIAYRQEGKVCECKAAEADVLLEAFGNEEFLSFAPGGAKVPAGFGTGEEDRATQWLTEQTLLAAGPWKTVQDSLRGTALGQGGGSLQAGFQGIKDAFSASVATTQDQQQRALNLVDSLLGDDDV